ncbi:MULTISPECIES: hypothetical protein [unclassified Streptomyces]|uniref:hypothetical protein n=1 Tax=unclassified Streptomyces TaxID=2593676 RepID=UPI0027D8D5C5|nr:MULTISPECIES: hypothetical protein [unclassified Streptomyces]
MVGRVRLDVPRSRRARGEQPLESRRPGPPAEPDPAQDALLADSAGAALLVVLDTPGTAERPAFVLHDLSGVPFEEVGRIVGRGPAAARQRSALTPSSALHLHAPDPAP